MPNRSFPFRPVVGHRHPKGADIHTTVGLPPDLFLECARYAIANSQSFAQALRDLIEFGLEAEQNRAQVPR